MEGCQIISIDLNFYLQKYLEIFDENSAEKIQSKNYKGVNPPCLMPIRVELVSQILGPNDTKAKKYKILFNLLVSIFCKALQ